MAFQTLPFKESNTQQTLGAIWRLVAAARLELTKLSAYLTWPTPNAPKPSSRPVVTAKARHAFIAPFPSYPLLSRLR
jgi:hypothetical protein